MQYWEWVAAALGLVNVGLVVARSVWNYPFGIVMVSIYFFVFADARLYSDALLQIFFLTIQIYGWRNWLRSRGAGTGPVPVGWLTVRARLVWLAGTAAAAMAWGLLMARYTDAAAPMIDAGIAVTSISAQILLSLRRVENWVLWIAVDAVAIGLFHSRGLEATAALYAVFLVMASTGLYRWTRAARVDPRLEVFT